MGLREAIAKKKRVAERGTETKSAQVKATALRSPASVKSSKKDDGTLQFPQLYRYPALFNMAHNIYEDFVSRLKTNENISEEKLRETIPDFLADHYHDVTPLQNAAMKNEMIDFIVDHLKGYGPVSSIFRVAGDGLNDVIINTKEYIDIIYDGKTIATPYRFKSESDLRRVIDKMLAENNRKIDDAHPIASSKLRDGSRIEAQIPPVAANDGSCLTLRKFRNIPLFLEQIIDGGQMDMKMAYFLLKAIQGKLNIIVSGGTSSGKTTFLNTMTRFVDEGDQLLTIEDTKEIMPQMPCHSVRAYEARPANEEGKGEITLEMLLRSALRSSPRRIIVGECRGGEIVVMLNAMNTGHPGSMTTVHADDTKEAIVRIENMYLEARPTANSDFIRAQIVSAVDLIVQLVRFPDGTRKVIKISEVEKRIEDGGVVSLLDIFQFKRDLTLYDDKKTRGKHIAMATPSRAIAKMEMYGVDIDKRIFDDTFVMEKEMLIDEFAKFLPDVMCGWQERFIHDMFSNDPDLFERWPHLSALLHKER